ncbi:hypothetical protein KRMM14A1004_63730 [Krasilnikovia sp. MM14-A1004]
MICSRTGWAVARRAVRRSVSAAGGSCRSVAARRAVRGGWSRGPSPKDMLGSLGAAGPTVQQIFGGGRLRKEGNIAKVTRE